jgi:hypothetical protein
MNGFPIIGSFSSYIQVFEFSIQSFITYMCIYLKNKKFYTQLRTLAFL